MSQRPHLVAKYRLDATIVEEFMAAVRSWATWLNRSPHVFVVGRAPDDAHCVDLAWAADAQLIVSRDRRLLDFALGQHRKARTFNRLFPQRAILTPPEALALVRATQTATSRVDQDNR